MRPLTLFCRWFLLVPAAAAQQAKAPDDWGPYQCARVVIHYTARFSEGGKLLTFLSDAGPQAPRQRLTNVQNADGTLKAKFELAPPGKPEAFVTHVEGVAHRMGAP